MRHAPARDAETPVLVMEYTAIAHEEPARRIGNDLAEWGDAVLERHELAAGCVREIRFRSSGPTAGVQPMRSAKRDDACRFRLAPSTSANPGNTPTTTAMRNGDHGNGSNSGRSINGGNANSEIVPLQSVVVTPTQRTQRRPARASSNAPGPAAEKSQIDGKSAPSNISNQTACDSHTEVPVASAAAMRISRMSM